MNSACTYLTLCLLAVLLIVNEDTEAKVIPSTMASIKKPSDLVTESSEEIDIQVPSTPVPFEESSEEESEDTTE